jgi:hypothetical protein
MLALAGAALAPLLCAAVLWRQGALPAAYEALVRYNQIYAAEAGALGWDPGWLWRIWRPMLPIWLPAAGGLVLAWRYGRGRSAAHAVAALWGLALFASALLSLRAYPHYYLAAVPFGAMWAGAGIATLGRLARGGSRIWLAPAQLGVLLALVWHPVQEVRQLSGQSPHEQSGSLYGTDGWMFFGVADTVAGYVREHVPPDQPIFVWAAEPEIYYLAERAPAARFVYDYPLGRLPGARDEVVRALEANPPPLIITYHDVRPEGFGPFVSEDGYRLQATIAGYDLYGRP